jgi:molybdenum cofactor guanylyltransferase
MGRPKDQLELGGETMLVRQVRLLRAIARSVAVVGGAERWAELDVEVIPDELPGLGPLSGIATALGRTRTEYNLFVGCDAPFLQARFLQYLCARALEGEAEATVPQSFRRGLQPTTAVYRRRALKAIRASLERGDYSVRSFFPRVRCRVLSWPEIARAGYGAVNFENINTPEDYRSARLRLGWHG